MEELRGVAGGAASVVVVVVVVGMVVTGVVLVDVPSPLVAEVGSAVVEVVTSVTCSAGWAGSVLAGAGAVASVFVGTVTTGTVTGAGVVAGCVCLARWRRWECRAAWAEIVVAAPALAG